MKRFLTLMPFNVTRSRVAKSCVAVSILFLPSPFIASASAENRFKCPFEYTAAFREKIVDPYAAWLFGTNISHYDTRKPDWLLSENGDVRVIFYEKNMVDADSIQLLVDPCTMKVLSDGYGYKFPTFVPAGK
jgi:hypothetical protein